MKYAVSEDSSRTAIKIGLVVYRELTRVKSKTRSAVNMMGIDASMAQFPQERGYTSATCLKKAPLYNTTNHADSSTTRVLSEIVRFKKEFTQLPSLAKIKAGGNPAKAGILSR
jgi:hypothetical protein